MKNSDHYLLPSGFVHIAFSGGRSDDAAEYHYNFLLVNAPIEVERIVESTAAIRARVPDGVVAVLDHVKREARNEALREAADVARDRHIAWHKQGEDCAVECDVTACRNIANAITTLIEKDATND